MIERGGMIIATQCKECGKSFPARIPFCPYCEPEQYTKLVEQLGRRRMTKEDNYILAAMDGHFFVIAVTKMAKDIAKIDPKRIPILRPEQKDIAISSLRYIQEVAKTILKELGGE